MNTARVLESAPASDGDTRCGDSWDILLDLIRFAVHAIGPKQVAHDNNMTVAHLSHALAERAGHRFPGRLLDYINEHAPNDDIATFFAAGRRKQLEPIRPMTAEEERANWRSFADRLPAAVREAAYREVGISPELRRGPVSAPFDRKPPKHAGER